jgi:hypothetical protein
LEVSLQHEEARCWHALQKLELAIGLHARNGDHHQPGELLAKLRTRQFIINAQLNRVHRFRFRDRQWRDRLWSWLVFHHDRLWCQWPSSLGD